MGVCVCGEYWVVCRFVLYLWFCLYIYSLAPCGKNPVCVLRLRLHRCAIVGLVCSEYVADGDSLQGVLLLLLLLSYECANLKRMRVCVSLQVYGLYIYNISYLIQITFEYVERDVGDWV